MANETRYAVTSKEGTQPVGTYACFKCILCGFTCNISLEVAHMGTNLLFKKVIMWSQLILPFLLSEIYNIMNNTPAYIVITHT